jgi:hypothetical protein
VFELCMMVVLNYLCGLRIGCGLVKMHVPAVCGFEFLHCV